MLNVLPAIQALDHQDVTSQHEKTQGRASSYRLIDNTRDATYCSVGTFGFLAGRNSGHGHSLGSGCQFLIAWTLYDVPFDFRCIYMLCSATQVSDFKSSMTTKPKIFFHRVYIVEVPLIVADKPIGAIQDQQPPCKSSKPF